MPKNYRPASHQVKCTLFTTSCNQEPPVHKLTAYGHIMIYTQIKHRYASHCASKTYIYVYNYQHNHKVLFNRIHAVI